MKRIFSIFLTLAVVHTLQAQPGRAAADTSWKKFYRESAPIINDLLHTKVDARFDYSKSYMYGKVWLTLQPHFYATDSLTLDAKGMEIKTVAMMKGSSQQALKYNYDGLSLRITLDKLYKGGEKYTIYIDYTAKPSEFEAQGSGAISDARGLYFINPKGEDKEKPVQIWTQGETEATSVWCPTIDKPNQKTTQETYMTVPDKYVTLSNGKLASSKKNADGTRTDYWKMELPHAPYLFFMGVGDFAVVKDTYKGKEVNYYVEKEFEPVARKIFGNTPEMMAYFSRITGVEYPWAKYSQMTARDYVSGAMENTTATLHQEGAQQDARELIDGNRWESTIAHELFHQWFGDYVTSESWSNLTLNESFANYSETLWDEYKYGKDAGDAQNYSDMQGYLRSGSDKKDLVRYHYADKEDMFDAVSYNKGGRILHMLRNQVGDDAFFKALNVYLTTNKFKSAEAHQLRLAFEEVTGRDLNWYFNQWYFGSGHPKLSIDYVYDDEAKQVKVMLKQTQSGDKVFRLPMYVDIYNGKTKTRRKIWMTSRTDSFTFAYTTRPDLVNVDGDKVLLAAKTDNKTLDNYLHQYKYAGNYVDRREAIEAALKNQSDDRSVEILKLALKDPYHGLRTLALQGLDLEKEKMSTVMEPLVYDLARNDKKSTVRSNAIDQLSNYSKPEYTALYKKAINDSSYSVAGAALEALTKADIQLAIAEATRLSKGSVKGRMVDAISGVKSANPSDEDFDLALKNFESLPLSQEKFNATETLCKYMANYHNTEKIKKATDAIIAFREAIPAGFKSQTDPVINNVWLSGIVLKAKETAIKKGGDKVAAIQEQVEYIKSKLPKQGF
jgi:aminopeptidase N